MSKDLEFADRHHLRLIIEHLKALVGAFEAYLSDIESSEEGWSASEAEGFDTLNIEGLNLKEIHCEVAKKRLEQYRLKSEAAESLDIDMRTLRRYAAYKEPKQTVLKEEENN